MGKTVSASAISEYLSDERASKKKKTIKLSAPEYKYNDDLESGALDIAKGVGQAASLVMLPSGIASITRGVGKVTGRRNETAEKVTSALAMPSAKMWQGFMSGAEGIYDFVIGGGTQIAGAVSKNKNVKDAAKWIYSNSWSSELSGAKDIDETLQNESKAYKVTGDILSGVGNVAFQMGLAMLTMGAANAATAAGSAGALAGNSGMSVGLAKGITYGSLFASAAGSGTAESMSKTGDLGWRENLSGVLKGGVEVATELISPTGQLIGTKFLENAAAKGSAEAAKKLAAKTMGESIKVSTKRALAKKLVSNFAGEATEEMLSYAGGWLIENKLDISDEKFSVQEMLYQGLMGGIAGSIFSSPADVHMFRVNKSTGAAVYAKGDAYAQGKINEGLTLVKLYKEKGVKGGAIDLAEAALTKLATDETLSQTQKEYYMGLAENVVLKTDLSETAKQYATDLAERAAADPSYAESVAKSLNAIVNEAGGKGEYTAADIANKDSEAARIVTLSQMLSDFVNPSADERIIHSFIDAANNATDWNNSAEQLDAVRNLQVGEDQQLVYKVDYVKDGNVYAVVKKRVDPKTGKESYSLAYTTTGQITSENPQLYPMHDLSYDEVTSFLEGGLYSEQEVDQMISKEQDRRETEAEQRREREQAQNAEQNPNRKKKKKNAKKNAQTGQAGEQTQANRATQEDLSAFERSMMPKLGIDNSDFTQDEWITARDCIPNIDNLTRREQARILTLVRTANATGQNADYVKGLARLSAAFGFGVVFYPDTKASGFYQRGNDMVFINPGNLDVTYGHEIQHSYDQEQKNGVAVYRTDLIEAVKKIVGEKVFEKAKAQYKADYKAFRKETGVRPISDAELEGEASANVVGKYLSNMTLLKKLAATDYSLGRGLLAAIRRMKDKWTSAKAFAKENDSTAFAEYRKMTRIENLLMKELGNKEKVINNSEISYSVSAVKTKSGDLVALHNLSEDRLKKAIELGGFPMPSIAVTKTSLPHTGYGDITVVFGENTIDPEMDARNYVYDRDGWTPTAPRVDVKLDEGKVDNLISELKRSVGDRYYADRVFAFFDGRFTADSGEYIVPDYDYNKEKIGQYAFENAGVLAAYLNENGLDTSPVYSERTVNLRYTYMPVSEARRLLDFVGITQDMDARTTSEEKRAEIRKKFYEYQDKTMLEKLNGKESADKLFTLDEVKRLNDKNRDGSIDTALFWLADDTFSGNEQKVVDNYATLEMLQNKVESKEAFYNWIWDKLNKTFEKRGIDSDSDIFDRRGNRRSFEQRHYDYTIENVIRVMKKGEQTGKGVLFGGASAVYLAAKLSRQFDSISSIREAQDHLARVSDEDMKAFEDKTYELFDEVVTEIAGESGDLMNDMTRRDDVEQILAKCAEASPLTVANIKRVFERETQGYNLNYKFDGEIARKVLSLFQTLENVPTMYFEAKPRRAVGLSEIKMVEIPNTASKELRTILANNEIPFEVYGETDEQRARAISNLSDVSFSPAPVPVTPETDSRYLSLARDPQKNESELRRLVKEAAEKAGFPSPMLYHGTRRFGFTRFNTPLIYATEKPEVAANYGGSRDIYAGQRSIGKRWNGAGTLDALIENASTIAERKYKLAKQSDIDERKAELEQAILKVSHKTDDINADFGVELPDNINNAYSWVMSAIYEVQENGHDENFVQFAKEDAERYREQYEMLRDWLYENKDQFTEAGKEYASFLRSWEFSDALIDFETYFDLSAHDQYLYWEDNKGRKYFTDVEWLREKVEELHDQGAWAYRLYGNPGNNVLEIDAGGRDWVSIEFNGGLKSTDTIAKWAKENGYTAVYVKNVIDGGDLANEYIFFEPNQVKSADPVTYDDSGNIIPLSERFNPQNDDIRYSPASTNGSGRIVIQASQSRPTGKEKLTNLKGELSRSNFRAALESLQVIAVNAQQGVENQLVRAGLTKREAAAFSQLARSGRSHAINAICYKLADMTGAIRSDGLIPILEPFLATKGEVYPAVDKDGNTVQSTAKGGELAGKRYSDFSDYYAMLHAIDRAAVNKNPYSSMTVAQMKQIVAEYEQKNPDFKAAAEKLSAFNSAMLDIEVQAGIITQETADLWRKQYPHYVPMYTQDSNAVGGKPVRGSRNMEVRRDNAAATESDHRVSDPLCNYIDQTQRRIRAAKLNILLNEVYNSADGVNVVTAEADRAEAKDLREREQAYLENPESENDPAEMFRKFKRGKNTVNEVSFYKDGKRVTMAVTDRIYTGLSDLGGIHSSILDSWTVKAVKKVNDTFKKLVTNWNPFFAVKNIARDLQDGTLQSRFGMGEFLNMYRKNAEMMATGKYNDMWEEFLANGGLESSLYSDEFGTFTKGGKSGLEQATGVVGQFQHIKNFNTLTEALPRFTEYCLTRKHGGSVQTALLNAADVTVNFGRSGTLIRILNSTVSPFLNPAVQGLDRVIRLFTEDGIKNNKALASLLLKAVLLAIVPMALGNAMYGDDDEYKDMKDSIKENNYLFKVGDTWLKLPRGRVVSTVAGLFNRSYKQLTGQETDWGDYGKNVLDQITPAQNVARHIGSPFFDVANNRTWYGTKIESDALQNYAVNQRYDENTSRISVWIGQLTSHFGLSPKEVNYLIDQYTGVVGDILLPTTTPAGTKGVVSYNFTIDPNTSSNLSNRFYDLYNKTMYKSNDGDVEAYYLKKRLDETKSAVSELFKQIKTINLSTELSNKEKVKQASAIRASINQLYKTALDDRRLYEQNIKDALAIENSYAVEQITAQSAKRYGLDSDAVGKYALTFGGDFVKKYDTEAQANDYKADASKKTVYAEANRLTYGAEYALREYNSNVYEKAQKLNELGIDWEDYYSYYMTARYYSGKTKKDKILAYLNGSGLSKSQIALMMYYSGYSAYADEAKKAIKASSLSAERKKELLAGLTN